MILKTKVFTKAILLNFIYRVCITNDNGIFKTHIESCWISIGPLNFRYCDKTKLSNIGSLYYDFVRNTVGESYKLRVDDNGGLTSLLKTDPGVYIHDEKKGWVAYDTTE